MRTEGTLGPSGSVTSSTSIANLTGDEGEPFTAADVTSTCTAASALSGSTTMTNGMLQTDSGDDRNGDGDTTDPGEHAPLTVPVPATRGPTRATRATSTSTAPKTTSSTTNTQVLNPDGSLTVNAAHERFLGPTVVGTSLSARRNVA